MNSFPLTQQYYVYDMNLIIVSLGAQQNTMLITYVLALNEECKAHLRLLCSSMSFGGAKCFMNIVCS